MMNLLNLSVKVFDNLREPNNCEFWIVEKNEFGKYKVKDNIFKENKE